jgi:hypothetical protein
MCIAEMLAHTEKSARVGCFLCACATYWFCRLARDQLSHSCEHYEFGQSVQVCCRLEQSPILRRIWSVPIEMSDPHQNLLKPEHLIRDGSAAGADGDADCEQEMPVPAQIEVVRKASITALGSSGASRIFEAVTSKWGREKRARRARGQAILAAQEIKVVNACGFRLVEEDEFKTRTYVCSCPMCRKRHVRYPPMVNY